MGFLSFISRLLGLGRRFNGSPEQYLAMVRYVAFKNNPSYSAGELLQWGDVMQKVMKVDLAPYKDFNDLVQNGRADNSMIDKVDEKFNEIQQRKELKQAIYGDSVDLGEDDVMKSNCKDAIYARQFVKDLSQHVNFPEEEQRHIHNM